MRNIQDNDYSDVSDTLSYYADLINNIRALTSAPIVLGGAGFSIMPTELMQHLKPDFGISGEGERAFPQLVAALDGGAQSLDSIGALYHWRSGALVANPRPAGFIDLNRLPVPDRTLLERIYYDEFGIDSVQTKRGCRMQCDYCRYPRIEGNKVRLRDPVSVVDEMFAAVAAQPSLSHFFIVDSVFNLPLAHAKEVCRELISRQWTIPWTCYSNPIVFDEEFAALAVEAGCAGMEVGADAGSDSILKKLKKGFTTAEIRRIRDVCSKTGILDCHSFVVGTDGETIDDVRETIDFVADLDPHSAIINIWIDDYESLNGDLRRQRVRLRSEVEELLLDRHRDFPNWSVPALGINFDKQLFRALRRAGRRGPMWQHLAPRQTANQACPE